MWPTLYRFLEAIARYHMVSTQRRIAGADSHNSSMLFHDAKLLSTVILSNDAARAVYFDGNERGVDSLHGRSENFG